MPANALGGSETVNSYYHIFNKGVEQKSVLLDTGDYDVFVGYLKEYLSAPADPASTKQTFTVKGRTYSGIPHMPKNYFGDIELVAYSLMPDHFHLVVKELTKGAISKFMRSLCTRYSMYFNKKYKRRGSLFSGPYRSVLVENTDVLPLIALIHTHNTGKSDSKYSSHRDYIGEISTSWVKVIIDTKDVGNYKAMSLHGNINLPSNIVFDKFYGAKGFVDPNSLLPAATHPKQVPELTEAKRPRQQKGKVVEYTALSFAGFALLFTLGLRNIWAHGENLLAENAIMAESQTKAMQTPVAAATPEPLVAAAEDTQTSIEELIGPLPTPKIKIMVKISIKDGSKSVNIRRDPTVDSESVGEAFDGETYEFVSEKAGWYRFKLIDGTGYVSSRYAEIDGEVTNNE